MSPITKTFIVLHVVLSMLLTAGVIVFVNQVQDSNKVIEDQKTQLVTRQRGEDIAKADAATVRQALTLAQTELANQARAAESAQAKAQADLAALEVRIADAGKQLSIAQVTNASLNNVVAASQAGQAQYMTMVADLRGTVDKLTKEKSELDIAIADLTQQRDVLERQRRDLAEKVTAMDSDLKLAMDTLKANNLTVASADRGILAPPRINGVINDVKMIEQIKYATISVGSAQAVLPKMEFKVIDRRGEFLGMLRVEKVDTDQATGRLFGPNVDRIQVGAEVRTQL